MLLCAIWKSTCPIEDTLIIRLENGLERKKMGYLLHSEESWKLNKGLILDELGTTWEWI